MGPKSCDRDTLIFDGSSNTRLLEWTVLVPFPLGWVSWSSNLWRDAEHPPVWVTRWTWPWQCLAGGYGRCCWPITSPGWGRGAHREVPANPRQTPWWSHPPPPVSSSSSPQVVRPFTTGDKVKSHTTPCTSSGITLVHLLTCEITAPTNLHPQMTSLPRPLIINDITNCFNWRTL